MEQINILSQSSAILLILIVSIIFVLLGVFYTKKYQGLTNYLVANRSIIGKAITLIDSDLEIIVIDNLSSGTSNHIHFLKNINLILFIL